MAGLKLRWPGSWGLVGLGWRKYYVKLIQAHPIIRKQSYIQLKPENPNLISSPINGGGPVDDVFSLFGQHHGAKVLAGGHSLIPAMKLRLTEPETLIDISRIKN